MPLGTSVYDAAKIQGRLWTPDLVRSLRFAEWYSKDLQTITCVSGAVSAWADRGSNGYTITQAVAANRPAFSNTSFLVNPGVTFDGTNDVLVNSAGLGSATYTCVAIVYPTTTGGGSGSRFIAAIGGSGGAANGSSLVCNIATQNKWGVYTGTAYQNANSQLSANTPYILVLNGIESGDFYLNGVIDGSYTAIGAGSSSGNVGIGSGGNGVAGIIGYLAWLNVALSNRIRNLFEGWGAWDFGFQDRLPADHPFRNRPPMIGD